MGMTKRDEVRVFAPATVSNLGPGFDALGLALREPGDVVTARSVGGSGVRIMRIQGDGGKLPREADANTAGIAAAAVLRRAGVEAGIELELDKGMPIGSGLGSSAASAVAAAFAVNLLVGAPLRKAQLIEPCLEAESFVAGRHADNVAPALLGGLVLVRSVDPVDVVRLPVPEGLTIAVVTPHFELATRRAREVLPAQVPLSAMVHTAANLASFVSALYANDIDLLGRSVQDQVVTPARAALIPGCAEVMRAALATGAIATSISGAGPSIFALCHAESSARRAAQAMSRAFADAGLASDVHLSPLDCPGVRRL
ncbi:MAG: homoserine kinase [Polyangiaceae bacterium]|jgi:homoserine kinase|nr:homoserine kinase [Polyangiaceae bacterium]